MVIVTLGSALAVLWRNYVKVRDAKDVQGKDFLQMFAEAQSDAFAQIKDSDLTLTKLIGALEAVKEQGARVETRLEKVADKLPR
jgi:hypothetical protein